MSTKKRHVLERYKLVAATLLFAILLMSLGVLLEELVKSALHFSIQLAIYRLTVNSFAFTRALMLQGVAFSIVPAACTALLTASARDRDKIIRRGVSAAIVTMIILDGFKLASGGAFSAFLFSVTMDIIGGWIAGYFVAIFSAGLRERLYTNSKPLKISFHTFWVYSVALLLGLFVFYFVFIYIPETTVFVNVKTWDSIQLKLGKTFLYQLSTNSQTSPKSDNATISASSSALHVILQDSPLEITLAVPSNPSLTKAHVEIFDIGNVVIESLNKFPKVSDNSIELYRGDVTDRGLQLSSKRNFMYWVKSDGPGNLETLVFVPWEEDIFIGEFGDTWSRVDQLNVFRRIPSLEKTIGIQVPKGSPDFAVTPPSAVTILALFNEPMHEASLVVGSKNILKMLKTPSKKVNSNAILIRISNLHNQKILFSSEKLPSTRAGISTPLAMYGDPHVDFNLYTMALVKEFSALNMQGSLRIYGEEKSLKANTVFLKGSVTLRSEPGGELNVSGTTDLAVIDQNLVVRPIAQSIPVALWGVFLGVAFLPFLKNLLNRLLNKPI